MGKKRSYYINNNVARFILYGAKKLYFERAFNIDIEVNDTIDLDPPYLVLANHLNTWDPIIINMYVNNPISFVASDIWFSKPILGNLLRYVGAIPKTKNKSDFMTIKKIITACNDKRVVGIFPEGKRSWEGITSELNYPTAKLVKLLKVPVVCVVMKGGYLALPRWARHKRKGKISISYKKVLTTESIKQLSVDDIYKTLTTSLFHDEYAWQEQNGNTYFGKDLAEDLEYFLFACPHCHTIGSLKSRRNILKCKSCNYKVAYNEQGLFEAKRGKLYFDSPKEWNKWQLVLLQKLIESTEGNKPLLQDTGAIYHCREQGKAAVLQGQGVISIVDSKFVFKGNDGQEVKFPLLKILGQTVQWNNILEFYSRNKLHRFLFEDKVSAYKWVQMLNFSINTIKEEQGMAVYE